MHARAPAARCLRPATDIYRPRHHFLMRPPVFGHATDNCRGRRHRGVGSRCEDGFMTTVRGPIRSTNTITADGHADDQSTARARAVEGLELAGYDVVQTNTLSSTAAGNITVRAVARSTEI